MAVFHPHTVKCVCGTSLVVHLADSINAQRSPYVRDRILRAELHRADCQTCGRSMTVEKPFYYTDLTRNAFFKVFTRRERHLWKKASQDLDTAVKLIPDDIANRQGLTLRVIFGIDELREKLLAQDANIDDRFLEFLKVLLVREHHFLLRTPRLRLVLDAVTDEAYRFLVSYEHELRQFHLALPLLTVNKFNEKPEQIKGLVQKAIPGNNIFDEPDHWVNMWRWSPQPEALNRLRSYAVRLEKQEDIDLTTFEFKQMLKGLPPSNHLPTWSKRDLGQLINYANRKGLQNEEQLLFEARFGTKLEDEWSLNENTSDIITLFRILEDLPDRHVEGNSKIHEIFLNMNQSGGSYRPLTSDIFIGSNELGNQERFEDLVRHEVGHAVHEKLGDLVTDWLRTRFGWRVFGTADEDIDQWVELMGGWSDLTASQKDDVRTALLMNLGNGNNWTAGPSPALPSDHPWKRNDFGPRLAAERTNNNWFNHHTQWHTHDGKAFFLNYWYKAFMVVNRDTLGLVTSVLRNYSAMSHFEFFADLYALYFDLDDPKRPLLPADVLQWLDNNIAAPAQSMADETPARPKQDWETIDRPEGKPE